MIKIVVHREEEVSKYALSKVFERALSADADSSASRWLKRNYEFHAKTDSFPDNNYKVVLGIAYLSFKAQTLSAPSPLEPIITLRSLARAIGFINSNPTAVGLHHHYRFDLGDFTSKDADNVLQVAMFETIEYPD
jgi:hypothetical protein